MPCEQALGHSSCFVFAWLVALLVLCVLEDIVLLHLLQYLQLRFIKEDGVELPAKIYLFQGLPKADKMELIIQKAVELGAFQVIPVAMKRCVVKLDEKKADVKIKRWQGIAEAAAKQSKRGVIPTVAPVMSYAQAVKMASEMDLKLVPYELAEGMEQTKHLIESVEPGQQIAIFIGPEGGFDPRNGSFFLTHYRNQEWSCKTIQISEVQKYVVQICGRRIQSRTPGTGTSTGSSPGCARYFSGIPSFSTISVRLAFLTLFFPEYKNLTSFP